MYEMPHRITPTMSSRKYRALDFIKRYYVDHGVSPTLAEIAAGLGVTRQHVYKIVAALALDGHITRVKGYSRGIMLIGPTKQVSELDALIKLLEIGWKVNEGDKELQRELTTSVLPLRPQLDHIPDVEVGVDQHAGIQPRH